MGIYIRFVDGKNRFDLSGALRWRYKIIIIITIIGVGHAEVAPGTRLWGQRYDIVAGSQRRPCPFAPDNLAKSWCPLSSSVRSVALSRSMESGRPDRSLRRVGTHPRTRAAISLRFRYDMIIINEIIFRLSIIFISPYLYASNSDGILCFQKLPKILLTRYCFYDLKTNSPFCIHSSRSDV